MSAPTSRRDGSRKEVGLEITLTRRRGGPVTGWTLDLSGGGMRVTTDRPLGVDEELNFDLPLGGDGHHVRGRARVVREHAPNVYALRFEALPEDAAREVVDFAHAG